MDYELVDIGIEHPDYFQGFGCADTRYNCAVYGIGDNPAEALDDLLELVTQADDIDVEQLEREIREAHPKLSTQIEPSAIQEWLDGRDCNCDPMCICDDCEDALSFTPYYHIGLRYNVKGGNK